MNIIYRLVFLILLISLLGFYKVFAIQVDIIPKEFNQKNLEQREIFLKYDFPETKDACKQFLTLVVGVLVFTLTF